MFGVLLLYKHEHVVRASNLDQCTFEQRMGKKKKKVVQVLARIIQSSLCNAFPEFKIYFQQSFGFSTIKKSL